MNKNSQQPLAIEIATPTEADISALPPITFRGIKVLTTELVAKFFGCEPKIIQNDYLRNQSRFELGKHCFDVNSVELKDFKNQYVDLTHPLLEGKSIISKNTPKLTLWTKRGVALLAKIVDTDQAWNMIEKLVDFYFDFKEKVVEPKIQQLDFSKITETINGAMAMANFAGLTGNQATISANKIIKESLGIDVLGMFGQTGLIAEKQMRHYNVTEIGKQLSPTISAKKLNPILERIGYQILNEYEEFSKTYQKVQTNNGIRDVVHLYTGKEWKLTPLGQEHAVLVDTMSKHSNGMPRTQIRWYESIVPILQAELDKAK